MSFEITDPDSFAAEEERKRDASRKRDGKKEKKEKGYQMFEEEDSEEDQLVLPEDVKSPSKAKKEKNKAAFKFPVPVRKEKTKEKEEKKDKESKHEEKEKKKEEKEKKKHKKEKKKSKHGHHDPAIVVAEPSEHENPIFGVPLATAVERNKSHDGIELPAIVRECIDYIEECGLACEGIYRISGVKSKVQHLKDCYNRNQPVFLQEHEPNIVASLLKQFLRDLPEPVLTTALMPKFEEASTYKSNKKKVEGFIKLIADLPTCNRLLLSWMIVHMTHVIDLAKENKMTLQNVSIVLSPTMQISHRVLNVLFSNVNSLFGDVLLRKYVPPLKPAHSKWSLELPDNPSALEEELAKQESLLNQLHADLNSGREDPVIEEQLWEVQRVVTQLKRKIKMAKKSGDVGDRRRTNIDAKRSSTTSIPSLSAPEDLQLDLRPAPPPQTAPPTQTNVANITTVTAVVEKPPEEVKVEAKTEGKTAGEVEEEKSIKKSDTKTISGTEPKKGVKFADSPKIVQAPEVKKSGDENVKEKLKDKKNEKEEKKDTEAETAVKKSEEKEAVEQSSHGNAEKVEEVKEERKEGKDTKEPNTEIPTQGAKDVEKPDKEIKVTEEAKESEDKETERPKLEEKKETERPKLEEKKETGRPKLEEQKETERPKLEEQKETKLAEKTKGEDAAPKPMEVSKKTEETVTTSKPDSGESKAEVIPTKVEEKKAEPKPKVAYQYRKPPNPPFVSTSLLQPMKAEIPKPKPKPPEEDMEAVKEKSRKSVELRALEEELLGEKKEEEDEDSSGDEGDIDEMLEEEYALNMEEEELLAIADELRQKIATERSEMERLTQEIQELQYLRQDSDLEDLSSSSNSSDESEDEDDLQELVDTLIQENQELEMRNTEMCQKIHEERMICLSVKLQIRLLQQKQLESSYG